MVSKAIHLGGEPKSEDKNICWDLLPTNGGQFPLVKPAELHRQADTAGKVAATLSAVI